VGTPLVVGGRLAVVCGVGAWIGSVDFHHVSSVGSNVTVAGSKAILSTVLSFESLGGIGSIRMNSNAVSQMVVNGGARMVASGSQLSCVT
jgi:hypothetical protein